ncbi:MAG: glycosyltransferase [Parachlamydiaceae bacterium]|nr:glycosyltransferase [Parachlamydiaceae bacterium]
MKKTPVTTPWEIDLSQRLNALVTDPDLRKVVYIYEKADTSTFRYRVYNMCQALSHSTEWRGIFFFEEELSLLQQHLEQVDVLIFVRTRWSIIFDTFLNRVKMRKIPVFFDVDDLVFDLDHIPLLMNSTNMPFTDQSYTYMFSYVSRLKLMGSLCDATIGTNDFLCERLTQAFAKPSFKIPNFLNEEQTTVSEDLFSKKMTKKPSSHFSIGYFSGTPTHVNDFKVASAEIAELLNRYPEMILSVVGFMEFPKNLQPFLKKKQIAHHPLVNFLELQHLIVEADVNIVPLQNNTFTNCKSELKFFEAAIVGTPTIATPTFTYRNSIVHQKTGFLCDQGDWYSNIEAIYRNPPTTEWLTHVKSECLDRYGVEAQVPCIVDVLTV